MTLTLLLDLDGTLLGNDINDFVVEYTQALGKHLAPYVDPGLLATSLTSATQQMVRQQRPEATLQDTFDGVFYPELGIERARLQEAIDAFYINIFPTLKKYTQTRPEAVHLIEGAIDRGYRIAIATNPFFPRTAIEQRLSWAGLSPQEYPFAVIPSYETFHFVKPNPAFFAELLSLLGWPAGPVIMVGNELDIDVHGACLMGIRSFLVTQEDLPLSPDSYAPTTAGNLADILPWLDAAPPETLLPDFTRSSALLAILQATPAVLPDLAGRLPAEQWAQRPLPGEWSITEILCHLRDVEKEVNLGRFQKILLETNPFLPGMDTDPWAESRKYGQQDGRSALWDFIDDRVKLLALLDGLSPSGWQRPARHAIFGPTLLLELANIAAGHDRIHIQQIHQVLGKFLV